MVCSSCEFDKPRLPYLEKVSRSRICAACYHRLYSRTEKNQAYKKEWYEKNRERKIADSVARNRRLSNDPRRRWSHLRTTAKARGLSVEISFDQFIVFIKNNCDYCNQPVADLAGYCIDRLDNSKDYSIDNCVTCCPGCNWLKNSLLTPEKTKSVISLLKEMRGGIVWKDILKRRLRSA